MSTTPDSAVRTYIEAHKTAFLDDLADWLRIPSVSADPDRSADVRRSAEWLAAALTRTGFPVTEIWDTRTVASPGGPPGAPAVYAEWPSGDPDAPTVLVYGHHDVQPAARAHSGSFGGAVPNPAAETARLVAALHDADHRVAIPGFYDGVVELTDQEREFFAELPFDEARWLRTAKSYATSGEAGHTTLERIWARPTAEVNGIGGGYQGPGGKTIVPASAQLKLSFRLVAGQDTDRIQRLVTEWVADRLPARIRHEITFWGATRPCLTPLDHPALQSVVRAMGRAFGTGIRFTREGGSGPAADLQDVLDVLDVLDVPVLFLGISVPSDGWHSVNEKVELDLLLKGVETSAYLWSDLAETRTTGSWKQT
jgi:acetylornithine deacetylase/succinyl-diaminopimelate desuccinylase-like protein